MKQIPYQTTTQITSKKILIKKIAISVALFNLIALICICVPALIILAIMQFTTTHSQITYKDIIIAKGVYGGMLAAFTTPIAAYCTLISDQISSINNNTHQSINSVSYL